MEKFNKLTGIAAPMPLVNIDTDMIIPKQFLKTIKRSGLGANLFDEMRFDLEGNEIPDFVLNKKAYRNAEIIVAGENFGCGSSREHAPWALIDFGIKCVISSSYADIFYNNCFNNGILPINVDENIIQELSEYSKRKEEIEINLENQEILYGNKSIKFDLDPAKKKRLLEGLDDIGMSLEKTSSIDNYENRIKKNKPWIVRNDQN